MKLRPLVSGLVLPLWLAACAGGYVPHEGAALERPSAEKPVSSEGQRKAKAHVELGTAYAQIGRYGVALDEAREAASYDSSYAPAYELMGIVHMYLEENSLAASNFQRALNLAPGDPVILNSYGWFMCASGREREGLEMLNAAARNPYYTTPTRALANAGLCSLRLQNEPQAEQYFRRALDADGNNAPVMFHLAALSYKRGTYEIARRYLAMMHDGREPTAESLWLALRVERRLANRTAEASFAQQLKRRFPTSPEYQALLQGQFQ